MTATLIEVITPVVLVEIEGSSTAAVSVATPDLSVVEIITVPAPFRTEIVPVSQYLEVVDTAIRGEPGPPGPTGLVKVTHGSNPNMARPAAPLVYWVGSVTPLNADPDDLLMLKEA